MSHIELAKQIITDKKEKKHYNQKVCKKSPIANKNIVNIKKVDHDQMHMFATDWWNRWKDNKFIHNISKGWGSAGTPKQRTAFLEYEYLKWVKINPGLGRVIPCNYFVQQFDYCIPHFYLGWIAEEELLNRKYIKGELEIQILDFLFDENNLLVQKIYDHFDNEFEATIKAAITRMKTKGYLKEISFGDKMFYGVTENVKYDSCGYCLEGLR